MLLDHFLPLSIITRFVNSSNHYHKRRKENFPDLAVWKSRKVSVEFNVSVVHQFIAMIFYHGIVRLPSIKDYWDNQQYMPDHQIAKELGMTHDWLEDLDVQAEEEAGTSDEDDKKEGTLYDKSIKCIQHDQEDFDEDDE
eukprot:2482981-Ditylum_brightwellii.AAC.1